MSPKELPPSSDRAKKRARFPIDSYLSLDYRTGQEFFDTTVTSCLVL